MYKFQLLSVSNEENPPRRNQYPRYPKIFTKTQKAAEILANRFTFCYDGSNTVVKDPGTTFERIQFI